jgi:UDP-N-acetylglucosamine 1-carboxyvinyltransferase
LDSYHITGGEVLEGEYRLRGAKNAVLPILAATIVTGKVSRIKNCPRLTDIQTMVSILVDMGCEVHWKGNDIYVDSSKLNNPCISNNLMKKIRSSVFLMGPTLARCGEVTLSDPGGCAIGKRPIDIHLNSLKLLGVEISQKEGVLKCEAGSLKGGVIPLSFPSVGATENLMMAALMAEGETRILNPAKEPEIVDLQNYLNSCGAGISGAGSDEIVVKGGYSLSDTEYSPIPDRIEAGTLLFAAAATQGKILIRSAVPSHMDAVIDVLADMGCKICKEEDLIYLEMNGPLKAIKNVVTMPYPGFPTDMQSQLLALMSISEGTSDITESIFENRFKPAHELNKMGAEISINGKTAVVKGRKRLKGTKVIAEDLRGGASLVIAGLAAEGITKVENVKHIDRGYEKLENVLSSLGADIRRVKKYY